jgi:hypothetical protein
MTAALQINLTRADVALAIALFGVAIGIWNSWVGWRRDRLYLTVTPKLYRVVPGGIFSWSVPNLLEGSENLAGTKLCVEIKNESHCAVTVEEVGFYRPRAVARFVLLQHFLSEEQGKLPFRLEPFSAITVYAYYPPEGLPFKQKAIKYAYAETGHGRRFKGTSPVLKRLIREG